MTDPIRPWAKEYGDAIGVAPPNANSVAQRARLILAHRATQGTARSRWYAGWPLAAVGALGALLVYFAVAQPAVRAGNESPTLRGQPVVLGAMIAPSTQAEVLAFGSESRMTLMPQTQARVVAFSDENIEVEVEHGRLDADVKKRPGAKWIVRAGPYRVFVVGTAFTVSYDQAAHSVLVTVSRGAVKVFGDGMPQGGTLVQAGDSLAHQGGAESATPERGEDRARPETSPTGDNPLQALPGAPQQDEAKGSQKRSESSSTGGDSAQWKASATTGDYVGALREVDRLGVPALLRASSAPDLILLGNTARFGGRPELAEKAYEAVRTRNPGGTSAALCAYYLARIALDARGDSTAAIRYFRTYLKEARNGDLSLSARARLMDLLTKQGDNSGAQAVARDYLMLHPRGPHVDVARKLAGVAAPR